MNATPQRRDALTDEDATTYAGWFKALADPMRVRLLHLLAGERRPMAVGEITSRLPIGQSTVSHHLKVLADVRFVLSDRQGTSTHYQVNETCLDCFPAAVRAIMGQP
ncbi:metalloregulator ArsR/SmtB family transcription factor [Streptomyces sp. DK15]|uniref:ArsR/SmtB family transcription factor n=1 Tax=Streptomyces sp. DK15 TaxID=2957499 RepID=UPI0029BE424D|nr:metalloregulator ArsR/SmtB family transcription factor [Streptomyces sp. DK15]MDX2393612.1 metalloregulator ArsR/SmtB family transcription factor [Streptomyces sp. DK15]